eukprot:8067230-Pyramimonas_sp.AAC.1
MGKYDHSAIPREYNVREEMLDLSSWAPPPYVDVDNASVKTKHLGPNLHGTHTYPYLNLGAQKYFSKSVFAALRHDNSGTRGLNQFLDRRVNVESEARYGTLGCGERLSLV